MTVEDLTVSSNVGVRWQAQMEDFLTGVRESVRMLRTAPGATPAQRKVWAAQAQAEATAALALAVANGLGDLEGSVRFGLADLTAEHSVRVGA